MSIKVIKNWGSGSYNSLCHTDNRKYFSGLSLPWNQREVHIICLAKDEGKIWTCSCWEKVTLEWLMNSDMVKPEKFHHLHLAYHFTVPLITNTLSNTRERRERTHVMLCNLMLCYEGTFVDQFSHILCKSSDIVYNWHSYKMFCQHALSLIKKSTYLIVSFMPWLFYMFQIREWKVLYFHP